MTSRCTTEGECGLYMKLKNASHLGHIMKDALNVSQPAHKLRSLAELANKL